MRVFPFLLAATVMLADSADLFTACSKRVYCNSKLQHQVQINKIYEDIYEFLNLHMNYDENQILDNFEKLLISSNNNLRKDQLKEFVNKRFSEDNGVEQWMPPDFNIDPDFLHAIKDDTLRDFARSIHSKWPSLARKVKDDVVHNPDRYSLIPVTHGFFIPGGMYMDMYYWDCNWMVKGLLISGMQESAKGIIENLFELVLKLGYVPSGNRWYYERHSQPPLLTEMVATYYNHTNDKTFLRNNIAYLEKEIDFWLNERSFNTTKNGKSYKVLRYFVPGSLPRPYSYYFDIELIEDLSEQDRIELLNGIWSAFESGWDFSSRWFINPHDNTKVNPVESIRTMFYSPVDLNAIIAGALQHIANFHTDLMNTQSADKYTKLAKQFRETIYSVFWNEADGIWYDYDLIKRTHRKYFYTSNFAPLWQSAVEPDFVKAKGEKILMYLVNFNVLDYPGGVPISNINSGQLWDFPNMFPSSVSVLVKALEAIGTNEARDIAFQIAKKFVRTCHVMFMRYKFLCQNYDVNRIGECGEGGRHLSQVGYGWSIGIALEFLMKYKNITADDLRDQVATTPYSNYNESPNNSVRIVFGVTNYIIIFVVTFKNLLN